MKSILSFIVALGFAVSLCAQSSSNQTESFGGVEVGVFNANLFYEYGIAPSLSFRSEVGGYFGYTSFEESGWYMNPYLSLNPRFFFNLNRRSSKGRNTSNNAADFLELRNELMMNQVYQNFYSLSIMPTIGHRRNIGNYFHYELAVGAGFTRNFNRKQNELGLYLRVNLGLHR